MTYTSLHKPFIRLSCMVLCGALLQLSGCETVSDGKNLSGIPNDPKAAARSRTALATEYLKNNQLDAAKRALELALNSDPDSADAHHMMAILLQQEGSATNHKKAEIYFKKAIKLQPDFPGAYNNYGVYLREDGRLKEAMNAFDIAGSSLGYPARGQALENLGRTALMMKQTAIAKNAFQRAIQADGNSIISHFELAEIYFQEQNVPVSSAEFQTYKTLLGNQPMGARSLWLGIRLANATGDSNALQTYAQTLSKAYPNSSENTQSILLLKGMMKSWQ